MQYILTYSKSGKAVYFIFSRGIFFSYQPSKMMLFCEDSKWLSIVNYLQRKLQLGCLIWFWISLCSVNHENKKNQTRVKTDQDKKCTSNIEKKPWNKPYNGIKRPTCAVNSSNLSNIFFECYFLYLKNIFSA